MTNSFILPGPLGATFLNGTTTGQYLVPGGAFVNDQESSSYSVSVNEAASALDTISQTAAYAVAVAETASAADTVSAIGPWYVVVAEAASASDGVSSSGDIFGEALQEVTSALDTVSLGSPIYGASIVEAASAVDTIVFLSPYHEYIVEEAPASDTVSMQGLRRGGWYLSFDHVSPAPLGQGPGNLGVLHGAYYIVEF
jgi:hypothetical protein